MFYLYRAENIGHEMQYVSIRVPPCFYSSSAVNFLDNMLNLIFLFSSVGIGGENASGEKQPLPGAPAVLPTTVSEYMLPHTQLELGHSMVTRHWKILAQIDKVSFSV